MSGEKRASDPDLPKRGGRSHPPSLVRLAERLLRDEGLVTRGDTVLCACSGGPDSTALLHVLALLRPRIGYAVAALGVDHGIRPEAPDELAIAADIAASLRVPFSITRVSVTPGSNLQARARTARLEALREGAIKVGARAIATGHTADDRAETLLIRLLRGAGPRGLAVMPPRARFPKPHQEDASLDGEGSSEPASTASCVELIRPLLSARRSDVLAHLRRHKLTYAEDPSNLDPHFTRVRVRRELIPLLEELSPKIVEHLSALADMLHRQDGDVEGPVRLGREQRLAIERAQRLGRKSVLLRVRDGLEVDATFPDGHIVLIQRGTSHRS